VSGNRQEARPEGDRHLSKDTHHSYTDRGQLQLPQQVTVAVAELAGAAREGLLALAVGTGLQVLEALLAEDVARLVGPKGRHNPDRAAVRRGSEPGQVTLGGRRVRLRRPRVRTADGTGGVAVRNGPSFLPSGAWTGRAERYASRDCSNSAAAFLADLRPAPPPAAVSAWPGCHAAW
jgi:hypothetical protein